MVTTFLNKKFTFGNVIIKRLFYEGKWKVIFQIYGINLMIDLDEVKEIANGLLAASTIG